MCKRKVKTYYIAEQIIEMKRKLEKPEQTNNTYIITAELDQRWFNILGELSKDTKGFVWIKVEGGSDDKD
jgi:hypothetical protein